MADRSKRLSTNVAGEFFVDSTCINCDTCRQLAPEVFKESGDYSTVYAQPETDEQRRRAMRALLCCPTGSIGTTGKNNAQEVMADFPLHLEDGVYYAGFNSPKSYGGNSYFVQHPSGNWLIDSPKFIPHLVQQFERLGGIKYIFLTHRDDVAESNRFAAEFGSKRIIHRHELEAQPDAEIVLDGREPIGLVPDFLVIPTPGHTRGHCVLLYNNCFLFTGDHLWWNRETGTLSASSEYCWYSWAEQAKSVSRLLDFSFQWVLPGHGERVKQPPEPMHRQLAELVHSMGQTRR